MNTLNNTYDFKELLNTKHLKLYYTQMLNAKRLENHDAVYVFDEVGCGKTISAILAIAKTIFNKKQAAILDPSTSQTPNFNILVLTPKSVCPQFKKEIEEKLDIDILINLIPTKLLLYEPIVNLCLLFIITSSVIVQN